MRAGFPAEADPDPEDPVDPGGIERRLAALLSADVVGYRRLMAEDEAATVRTLTD
jgi:class 3 adenylate cyclase